MTEHFVHSTNNFTVSLHGPDRKPDRELPLKYDADPDRVCLIKAASHAGKEGYKKVVTHACGQSDRNDFDVYADIVIMDEPGSSAVMFTADCATVFLYENSSQRGVILHGGRPAMTPTRCTINGIENVVSIALRALTEGVSEPEIEACITGSICGKCFLHDRPEAEHLIKPFFDWKGTVLNPENGALNLPLMIKMQLLLAGVSLSNITHDGVCTHKTPDLASYRRDGSGERNAIVAVLH